MSDATKCLARRSDDVPTNCNDETSPSSPQPQCHLQKASTTQRPHRFIEMKGIKPPSLLDQLPDKIETYITSIEPKLCKALLKDLASFMPLVKVEDKMKMLKMYENDDKVIINTNTKEKKLRDDWKRCMPLGHLRRVRRCKTSVGDICTAEINNEQEVKVGKEHQTDLNQIKKASQVKESNIRNAGDKKKSCASNEPPTKRSRKQKKQHKNNHEDIRLEVLIGSVSEIEEILSSLQNHANGTNNFDQNGEDGKIPVDIHNKAQKLQKVIQSYNLTLIKKKLPGRPARTQSELQQWNESNWWPTLYFAKQSDEYKENELELDMIKEEYGTMTDGMLEAFKDRKMYSTNGIEFDDEFMYGAAIICPVTNEVISTSFNEIKTILDEHGHSSNDSRQQIEQLYQDTNNEDSIKSLLCENPLNTPVMFAIQGVSRMERKAAIGLGMDNDSFKNNQVSSFGKTIREKDVICHSHNLDSIYALDMTFI